MSSNDDRKRAIVQSAQRVNGKTKIADPRVVERRAEPKAIDKQVGGRHYKGMKIQPVEYAHANKLPFLEGTIIKHVTRWREKNGIEDLQKAKHYIDMLIELEGKLSEEEDPHP